MYEDCFFHQNLLNWNAMFEKKEPLTYKKIFIFWIPLAATWLMMSTEGPFLAAVIARLTNPKYNLAAYGVAFSFAVLMEAPIIMIMSASTALVKDKNSYIKLRNFTFVLNGLITFIMIIFVFPPVFYFITQRLIGLPETVAELTHHACLVLLPWPGAIGYRRFYQGILIRSNLTRRVAYGTVLRLISMAATVIFCYGFFNLEGALVGALGLTFGVSAEAIASRIMTSNSVKRLQEKESNHSEEKPLTYRSIMEFYYPLALTSILALGVHPIAIFFIARSRMAIESLAVFPVIYSLVFIFRSMGLSFQEVGIALMGKFNENFRLLRNFAAGLGLAVTSALALITFTPLFVFWFNKVSGLSMELTGFSRFPAQMLVLLPGLTVLISFQRAILVNNKKTTPITIATSIEVVSIIIILIFTIQFLGFTGVISAALAIATGRLFANGYLFLPCNKVLNEGIKEPRTE